MNHPQIYEDNTSDPLHALDILNEMRNQGIESLFICALMESCQRYEGIRDLMEMWFEEVNSKERDKIITDLQESLDDIACIPETSEELSYLRFDDFDKIKSDIVSFKQHLRAEVDRAGGISELSKKTGIPQPSLSRFFTSASMPRRTTLFKIAKALNLPETIIGFKWKS